MKLIYPEIRPDEKPVANFDDILALLAATLLDQHHPRLPRLAQLVAIPVGRHHPRRRHEP